MPETTASLSLSMPSSWTAHSSARSAMPWPQPGHMKCGIISEPQIIADLEVGGCVDEHHIPLASSSAQIAISAGAIGSPLNRCRPSTGLPPSTRSTSSPSWPAFISGTSTARAFAAAWRKRVFGERPQRDRPEQADLQPLRAASLDGAARRAGADADGDDDHVGVVAVRASRRSRSRRGGARTWRKAATDCG